MKRPIPYRLSLLAFSLAAASGQVLASSECSRLEGDRHSAIDQLCPFKAGLARISVGGQWGLVRRDGSLAVAPQFDILYDLQEGFAIAAAGGEWGAVDRKGKWVIGPSFEQMGSFSEGLAAAKKDDLWGYVDVRGQWVIQPAYASAGAFAQAAALVRSSDGTASLIDRSGRLVKQFSPDIAVDDKAGALGLRSASVDMAAELLHVDGRRFGYPAKADDLDGYMDGRFKGSEMVQVGETTRRLEGLLNMQGEWEIAPRFASISHFSGSLAVAALYVSDESDETRFGLIDVKGEFIAAPAYERLRRDKLGHFEGDSPGGAGKRDYLDQSGKLLFSAACDDFEDDSDSQDWKLVSACGRSWVLSRSGLVLQSAITAPAMASTAAHMLLHTDGQGKQPLRFELFNAAGKRIVTSEALPGSADYTQITLIQQAPGQALPLALLTGAKGKVALITASYKLVTDPAWVSANEHDTFTGSALSPLEGPMIMHTRDGAGAVDGEGKWVIAPTHASLSAFQHGLALATSDDKKTFIDREGKHYAFPDNVELYQAVRPYSVHVHDASGEVYRLDVRTGNRTPEKPHAGCGCGPHRVADEAELDLGGLVSAQAQDLWGLQDRSGAWVVAPRFGEELQPLQLAGKLAGWISTGARPDSDGQLLHGWLGADGAEHLAPRFSRLSLHEKSGLLYARQANGVGVFALDGKVVVPPSEGAIRYLGDGWFFLKPQRRHGLLDSKGDWHVQPGAVDLSDLVSGARPYTLSETDQGHVLIDAQGRVSTRAAPQSLAGAREPSHWWWPAAGTDASGKTFTAFFGSDFKERVRLDGDAGEARFSEGLIAYQSDDGYVLANEAGRTLGRYRYDHIGAMHGGMAVVGHQAADATPALLSPKRLRDEGDRPRYGYLGRNGKLALPLRFDGAGEFSEQRATVLSGGSLQLIDTRGTVLLQGAWMCGQVPVLLDGRRNIIWPAAARRVTTCAR